MTDNPMNSILNFIQQFITEHGHSPTIREIATGCYLNPTDVRRYLDVLQAQGLLAREPRRARSIRLLETL
jgi:SOS-response transcriptional repressor LexA